MAVGRLSRCVVAGFVGVLILAGCGNSFNGAATGGGTHAVEHYFGTTDAPNAPKRVVTVGYTDDQTALALGVKPVGMVDQYPNEGGASPDINTQWPWVKGLWGSDLPQVVMTNGDATPNFEKIAALKPDLIVAVYSDIDKAAYDKLTTIAPTVARNKSESEAFSASWRDNVLQVARAVNKESQAQAELAEIDERSARLKAENPDFAKQTAVAVSMYKSQVNVFSNTDVRGQILQGLGFRVKPEIDQLGKGKFSFPLSNEQLDTIDVDRVFVINDGAEIEEIKALPAWNALRVTQTGRAVYLLDSEAPSIGAAMSQATLPSIPFAIDGVAKAAARS